MYDEENKNEFAHGIFLLCSWSINLKEFLKFIHIFDSYNNIIQEAFYKFAKALSMKQDHGYTGVLRYLNQFKDGFKVPKCSLNLRESCHNAIADNDNASQSKEMKNNSSLAENNSLEDILVNNASSCHDISETGQSSLDSTAPTTVTPCSNLSTTEVMDQKSDYNSHLVQTSTSLPTIVNESTPRSSIDYSIEVLQDSSTHEPNNTTPPIDEVMENEFHTENIIASDKGKNLDENENSSQNITDSQDDQPSTKSMKVPNFVIKPAIARHQKSNHGVNDPRLSAVPLSNSLKKSTPQPSKSKFDLY